MSKTTLNVTPLARYVFENQCLLVQSIVGEIVVKPPYEVCSIGGGVPGYRIFVSCYNYRIIIVTIIICSSCFRFEFRY